jgi:hypothetical protein
VTWAGSAMFAAWVADAVALTPDVFHCLTGPASVYVALYNSVPTPDRTAPRAESNYPAGEWVRAGRELNGPGWPAAGGYTAGGTWQDGAAGQGGAWGIWGPAGMSRPGVTLTGIAGDLMWRYNSGSPGAGRGICFHDFGGLVDVSGQLTLTWPEHPAGYFRLNVT